jgi:hypothetical protein
MLAWLVLSNAFHFDNDEIINTHSVQNSTAVITRLEQIFEYGFPEA